MRPDEFGAGVDGDEQAGAFMEHAGNNPSVVAERALAAVIAGHFLISPDTSSFHPLQRWRIRLATRHGTVAAFVRLGEIDTTDYDVGWLSLQMAFGVKGETL